jgi:N-acetylneuraminate synthase
MILIERCRERGIAFLLSPFDMQSLHFLIERLQRPTIKIPSGEITNGPLLIEIGRAGRRAILSTGMADPAEKSQLHSTFWLGAILVAPRHSSAGASWSAVSPFGLASSLN